MATTIPITLVGNNLGERHKYLNTLVSEVFKNYEEFEVIKNIHEQSPIDRLFKIDLASKIRNVEYIIINLKDDDMLYVSRALKSKWLIEPKYEHIVNPKYLEEQVYPEMITTAVNKMQHWIHLNLNDEIRCKQFFEYYRERNFKLAIKFLLKCSKDDIQSEFNSIIYKVTPHWLKVLSEKNPTVSKIFFDSIANDEEIKRLYLSQENAYFETLKHIFKTNPDFVLDVTEKYFEKNSFQRFSADQTKFIMKHHKDRFWKKPELYTAWILNNQAVANSLNADEAQYLIFKLARAIYLTRSNWFCYQTVEIFIKRLKPEHRAAFKKKVFVEKDVGKIDEEWPYDTPAMPSVAIDYVTIFDDSQPEPNEYYYLRCKKVPKRIVKSKRRRKVVENVNCCEEIDKSLLVKLFDEFRFATFGRTLYELRKRIAAESSPKNREFMIFVLISKTGGRPDAVASLLELLTRHVNEPANVRAAVIRSLVKRAQIWRLPEESWNQLLQFGQGLGLDGKTPEADCDEGFHSVVIRSLLQIGTCEPGVTKAFLSHFSDFTDFSLNKLEKQSISIALPKMLLEATLENQENKCVSVNYLGKLIETLIAYRIKLETYPGLIETIINFANDPPSHVDHLVKRLFKDKIARKQLFRLTSDLILSDASFLNALKHDTNVLDVKKYASCFDQFNLKSNMFLKKLSLYFNEKNGLASKCLQEFMAQPPSKTHAKPIAYLLKEQFLPYLDKLDTFDDKDNKLLATAIRTNSLLLRPALDISTIGWKKAGAKHVCNKLTKCRAIDLDNNIKELLNWKRTARTALVLSKRTKYQTEVFKKLASLRPTIAIKCGLKIMQLEGDKMDPAIWKTMKPLIKELDLAKPIRKHLLNRLEAIHAVPMIIRPAYSTLIYKLLLNIGIYYAMPSLCHIELILPYVEDEFLDDFIFQFVQSDYVIEKECDINKKISCTCIHIRILVKYLLLSKNEEEQKRKLDKYVEPFLEQLNTLREIESEKEIKTLKVYFKEMIQTLKYSKVFLSNEYISPLPVIEKIIVWLQKHFSIAEDFNTFAQLHMIMLLYKATQIAVKLIPDIISDKHKRISEGVEILANIFGRFLASEVKTLQIQYFDSIREVYVHSIGTFFDLVNSNTITSAFLLSFIKGILEEAGGFKLGVYLLENNRYKLTDEHTRTLVKIIKNFDDIESQFFASAYHY